MATSTIDAQPSDSTKSDPKGNTVDALGTVHTQKKATIGIWISRVIAFVLLIAFIVYSVQQSIQEIQFDYFRSFEDVILTRSNVSVRCDKFSDIDPSYCEFPLIRFDASLGNVYTTNNTGACTMQHTDHSSLANHPTNEWRLIVGTWWWETCRVWCAIASESDCVQWSNSFYDENYPSVATYQYNSYEDITYFPISFIENSWIPDPLAPPYMCHYLPSADLFFENNPMCRMYDWDINCGDNIEIEVSTPIFRCEVDPYSMSKYSEAVTQSKLQNPDTDQYDPDLMDTEFDINDPQDFYATCEECPTPLLVSIVGFFNEFMITASLALISSIKSENKNTEIARKSKYLEELKLYWTLFALSRAFVGLFDDADAIIRGVGFGGWNAYNCLIHIAVNSSVIKVLIVRVIVAWEFIEPDQDDNAKRYIGMAKWIPLALVGIFYCAILVCATVTHIVVFLLAYCWIVLGMVGIWVLMEHWNVYQDCECWKLEYGIDSWRMLFIAACLATIFYALLAWAPETVIAWYKGYPYIEALGAMFDRQLLDWFECSTYGNTLRATINIMMYII